MSQCPGFLQLLSQAAPICVAPQAGGHLLVAGGYLAEGALRLLTLAHLSPPGLYLPHRPPPAIHAYWCALLELQLSLLSLVLFLVFL